MAASLRLPEPPRPSFMQRLLQKRWQALAVWLLVIAAAGGAAVWLTSPKPAPLAESVITVPPIAPPLVAGVAPKDRPLPPAPDPRLIDAQKLPVAAAGTTPLQAYAYPFNMADKRPRIAVVLIDMGMQREALETALAALPGAVGIGLNVAAPDVGALLTSARAAGHETLLMVPMEGTDPDSFDPGPGALRRALTVEENLQRLHLVMGKGAGYVGLALDPDAGLLDAEAVSTTLLTEARNRGLLWLAPGEGMVRFAEMGKAAGTPVVNESVIRLDQMLSEAAVQNAFLRLESQARLNGQAVAVSPAYPFIINRLAQWLPTLAKKDLALAPISALVTPPVATEAPKAEAPHSDGHPAE